MRTLKALSQRAQSPTCVVVRTREMDGEMPAFWRNVWVPEKCMGSGKMYGFQRNVWVPEKCMGSREMYGFWRN